MSQRFLIASMVSLMVSNAGCTVIAPFDGRQPHRGGAGSDSSSDGEAHSAGMSSAGVGGGSQKGFGGVAGTTVNGSESPSETKAGTAGNAGISAGGHAGSIAGASSVGGHAGATFGYATSGGTFSIAGSSAIAGMFTAGRAATAGMGPLAGASGIAGANVGGCPGNGGPTMVMLPLGFCIDSTEVTRAQYTAWLNATSTATINAQDPTTCSWNTSFVPDATCMSYSEVCQGAGCADHPQVCVDWCDAYAYCKGVGKRMCGKMGGGANDTLDFTDPSKSQWFAACTSNGKYAFPYGDTYRDKVCNTFDYWGNDSGTTTPVASLPNCQGPVPYAGVFNMSGNVGEWEDACDSLGPTAICRTRGGDFFNGTADNACDVPNRDRRDSSRTWRGIRCCWP